MTDAPSSPESPQAPSPEALSQALEAMGAGAAAVSDKAAVAERTEPDAPPVATEPVDAAPMLGMDPAVLPPSRAARAQFAHVGVLAAQRTLDQPWVDQDTQSAVSAQTTPLLTVIASGSDLGVIAAGDYDERLRGNVRDLRALRSPVLLAPFAGLGAAAGDPQTFVAAWRRTREVLRAEHADQVQLVWCPSPDTFRSDAADRYYPGDDQVDWVCGTVVGEAGQGFSAAGAPLLDWSERHAVPVLVRLVPPQQDPAGWLRAAVADLRAQPRVRAVVYAGGVPDDDQLSALAALPAWSVGVGTVPAAQSATSITLPAAVAAVAAGASAFAGLRS